MSFGETKVYFDGSHYIAIPHTTRPSKKRKVACEEVITVIQDENVESSEADVVLEPSTSLESNIEIKEETCENVEEKPQVHEEKKKTIQITKKELFESLYQKYLNCSRAERKKKIIQDMQPYFDDEKKCLDYVSLNIDRKLRNLICRRIRMCRKANLAGFNYFCTFTYDNTLHTEETFKKGIRTCLRNLCYRKHWKYMGVWERAPETNRLHFHGLFNIPPGGMVGEIVEVRDYSTQFHKMQRTFQSTYFNKRFGRSDFKEIDENERRLGSALSYLMKYLEKTGEKIVYSKGLPQYFISDIMDDDIVCTIGQEDKKLLLFDDFNCWDEGVLIGKVSPEVIEQLRKCN